ncbi:hypothetical protein BcDW1_4795 [Botrytis cinerea BcDW1]|uniref:Uncharacterized protein n=2 Tax=Botryotinia fuckeliana TaxID=40559 RepID=G2YP25_BOTF4|nr:hypothetical protein BcDW1_4795 [Botrytis cinerea BcDW1]CCD53373.1 hypothetical protein BofuT4_P123920.1 [Botrytis cinerea T4]
MGKGQHSDPDEAVDDGVSVQPFGLDLTGHDATAAAGDGDDHDDDDGDDDDDDEAVQRRRSDRDPLSRYFFRGIVDSTRRDERRDTALLLPTGHLLDGDSRRDICWVATGSAGTGAGAGTGTGRRLHISWRSIIYPGRQNANWPSRPPIPHTLPGPSFSLRSSHSPHHQTIFNVQSITHAWRAGSGSGYRILDAGPWHWPKTKFVLSSSF